MRLPKFTAAAIVVLSFLFPESAGFLLNAQSGTPTLVQALNTSSTQGNVVNSYTIRLPNATLSGNAVIVAVQQNSGTGALSVSDNKFNAYTLARTNDDTSQKLSIYYATNVIAGAQVITLTFSGGANYVSAVAAEFYNVAAASALDGTSAGSGNSTSLTAGSLTTTLDNDVIFQYAVQDSPGVNSTTWTQGSNPWKLLSADFFDGQAAQYQIQTVHGAVNPTFGQGASNNFNTVAIALKAAAAGTAPSGIRVVHMGHHHVPQAPPGPTTFTLQSPSQGNLLVVQWIGAPGCHIDSVSDGSGSNSYTSTGAPFGNGGSGDSQTFYAASAVTSTSLSGPTLSLGSGCAGASHNAMIYDISGAAASPYDSVAGRATASGNQTTAGPVTTATITPSTANGLVITQTGVNSHTLISVTPGNILSTEVSPDINTGAIDNNNGWAINYNTDTSPETFVYGTKSGQLDTWASIAVAFKAGASPPSFDFSLSNAGNQSVVQGQAVSNTITAALTSGTTQSVSFAASGLPTGTTASFSPASCSPNCTSTLTLTTSASTPPGSSTITVTGTGGSLSRTTTFTLTVNAPPPPFDFSLSNGGNKSVVQGQAVSNTITATLVSGTTQSVSFSASGLPAGTTPSFSPASCNPTCSSTLTLTTSASAPTGPSTITVTGTSGSLSRTTTFTLTVNPPPFDFSLTNGGNQTVVQGLFVSNTITAILISGTTQSISFSASGLPAGTTPLFVPASCSPGCSSTLTLTTTPLTPTGSSTITVTGTGGSLSRTTTFTLTVTAAPPFDFSLSNGGNPAVVQGQSASNTITAGLISGSPQSVSFSASGLPAGTTASFSPASCSPVCSPILTLTTAASTPTGSSTITVTGTGASLSRTITFLLTVNASSPPSPPPPSPPPPSPTGTSPTTAFSIPQDGLQQWLTTAATSSIQVGYARAQFDAGTSPPSGLAIFGLRSGGVLVTEATVPASAAIQSGRIYAEVNGPVNTGVAFANPNSQDAVISFYFTDAAGTDSGHGSFTLAANRQMAAFLSEAPFNGRAPMQGTFSFSSSMSVGVIAVRGFTNERSEFLITTLPVAAIGNGSTGVTVLPHFADGGGWTTQVILTNQSEGQLAGTVQFFNPGSSTQSASPLALVVNGASNSSFNYVLPPRAAVRLVTGNPPGTVQAGTVRINPSNGSVAPVAEAIFSFKSNAVTVSEAGVSALPTGTAFRMYAEASGALTQIGSIQTGVAIANPSSASVPVNLELTRLDGSSLGSPVTVTVPPNGQIARFIYELFPTLSATFSGLLKMTATTPVGIIGVRGRYNERGDFLITTTPPRNEDAGSLAADVAFPQIAGGGGYTTQIILFGPPGSGKLWFYAQDGRLLGSETLRQIP